VAQKKKKSATKKPATTKKPKKVSKADLKKIMGGAPMGSILSGSGLLR
jgi:hypothetical protein